MKALMTVKEGDLAKLKHNLVVGKRTQSWKKAYNLTIVVIMIITNTKKL